MSTASFLRFIAGHPVNDERPFAALVRFARRQVGCPQGLAAKIQACAAL
jgi:hypothetical protein